MNEKIDETLKGLNIDRRGYVPPGGESWAENICPIMEKARREAVEELRRIEARASAVAEYRRQSAIAYQAAEAMLTQAELMGDEQMAERIKEFSAKARELMSANFERHIAARRDVSEIKSDIAFIDSLVEFIEADKSLDKLLYAMHSVELKYRTKIFRAVVRLLKKVESARGLIRASDSVLRRLLAEMIDPMLKTLDEAYARITPGLKALKRQVDAKGAEALADY